MVILMPTLLLIGLSNITGIQILTPRNREKQVLYSILWGAGIDFLLNFVLIPRYSSSGAAFATVAAELAVLAIQCIYLKEILKRITGQVSLGKILIATVASCGAGVGVKIFAASLSPFPMLAVSACAFFGIYGVVLLAVREKMTWEMVRMVIAHKSK